MRAENSISGTVSGASLQTGAIYGDVHIHSSPQRSPMAEDPPRGVASTAHRDRVPTKPSSGKRAAKAAGGYVARMVGARSPLLLWGFFALGVGGAFGGVLGALFGQSPQGATVADDLGIAVFMALLAGLCAGLLSRRRVARCRGSHAWPSFGRTHPLLASWLRYKFVLVLGLCFFSFLTLSILFSSGSSSSSGVPHSAVTVSELAGRVMAAVFVVQGAGACGYALLRRRGGSGQVSEGGATDTEHRSVKSESSPEPDTGRTATDIAGGSTASEVSEGNWLPAVLLRTGVVVLWCLLLPCVGGVLGGFVGALIVDSPSGDLGTALAFLVAGAPVGALLYWAAARFRISRHRRLPVSVPPGIRAVLTTLRTVITALLMLLALAMTSVGLFASPRTDPVGSGSMSALGLNVTMIVLMVEVAFSCGYLLYRWNRPLPVR